MVQTIQITRTITPNSPPAGTLAPGQLSIEMSNPTRLWIGVPAAADVTLQKLLLSSDPADNPIISGSFVITTDGQPPAVFSDGTLWFDAVFASLYVRYDDGTSSQWVPAVSWGALGAAAVNFPDTPINGQVFNAPNGVTYEYDGVKWNVQHGAPFLPLAGGTMLGPVVLNTATPLQPLHAAPKQYVDGALNNAGRNLIHNGLFNVWQRGIGPFTVNNGYTADRWLAYFNLDTASFQDFTLTDADRAEIGDEAATFMLTNSFTGNAGAASYTIIAQLIEDVRRLAGRTVTVSFYAQASTTLNFGVSIDQRMGTGGTPSADVSGAGQAVVIGAPWTRYSLTFAVPSLAGATLGTSGDYCTALNFWYSSGATNAVRSGNVGVQSGIIDIWGVQLEIGSTATPLEKLDPQIDLANGMRFYQRNVLVVLNGDATAGIGVAASSILLVAMRASPTCTILNNSSANVTAVAVSPQGSWQVVVSGNTPGTGQFALNVNLDASADL